MMCDDPKSGTDHSLKEVSAYLIWVTQGSCHTDGYAIFDLHLDVCVKDSSAKCTCHYVNKFNSD